MRLYVLLCVRTFKLISLSVNGFPDTDICADDWSCIGPERKQKTTDDYSHISFSCIPDKEIRVVYLDRQFLSHPCYLTQDRIKITCI